MAPRATDPLVELLRSAQFDAIVEMASENKRLLSLFSALTYHPERLLAWRSVQAFGMAAQRIAEGDAEYVRNHLRRQFWLVSDESGGIGWRAPELIGETLARCPGPFEAFVSPLIYILDLEAEDAPRFRVGTLWAIGRIAEGRPGVPALALPLILPCLADSDPQARGLALWCLGQLAHRGAVPGLAGLKRDASAVEIYQDGNLWETTVAALANTLPESRPAP
jgi:hypothetical protein